MPPLSSAELAYVQQWLEVADLDLAAAERMYVDNPAAFGYPIPFSCQQAIEKYCKGVLLAEGRVFRKTHDLPFLLQQLAPTVPFTDVKLDEADLLSDYAVDVRYPPHTRISVPEMQEALRIARYFQLRLRPLILAVLP
ncbi:HEPN domain-containing protein [Hymenobacter weizhouensis]|uniref:HEPN domain-containing protein n=1 Tax=Hymenobacter sp. YIM 151500-1 TaxID=2987689 RepID=UPI0022276EC2|nr:HEPN domain-containing protein [Hymenobacter sp. YIM 151500-1]UYZ62593.1 HEPN domain-containing protein [Hymenobacter sp. YIM 151500-1]